MRKPNRWLKAIGLIIGLGLLGWIINNAIAQSQSVSWPKLPIASLAAAFAMVIAARCLQATAWVVGAREVAPQIEWMTGIGAYSVTFLGRYIPGKIWQVGGLAYFASQRGANAVDIGVYSVVFLAAYQSTGGLMVFIAYMSQEIPLGWAIVIVVTSVIASACGLLWYRYAKRIVHVLPQRLRKLSQGAFKQHTPNSIFMVLLLIATWVFLATSGHILIKGFQPEWNGTWVQSTVVILGGIIAGFMFFIAPSGIGVREGMMLVLLELFGVDPITAFMIIVSHRLIMLAAEVSFAAVGALIFAFKTM